MQSQEKETLNWKQYFKNQNLLTDALKFKEWDQKDMEIPGKGTLIQDLTRTRNDDPHFKKEKTQRNLQLLATFYCQQNNVNYQQGMLEVIVPFLLLKNQEFPLAKCYAYLNSFMNMYFPKVLEQKAYEQKKELVHVSSAIQFSSILIRYHCADFYYKLMQIDDFHLSMVVCQWIMTLFAKGSTIPIVFCIFDQFMRRNNPNYIFYLISSLFEIKRDKINELFEQGQETLLQYLNKNLKDLKSEADVLKLFEVADKQFSQTPRSYDEMIQSTSFHEKTVLSVEEVRDLKNINESQLAKSMFVNAKELIRFCGQRKSEPDKKSFVINLLDIRKDKKKIKLKAYFDKDKIMKDKKMKLLPGTHYCIISDTNINEAIDLAEKLVKDGYNYISILQGGMQEIQRIIKPKQQDQCYLM